jgi:AraC-like DNA-binding protein/mannose-6-phosphate isomerase-like protein (cupin superfamily)
MTQGEHGPVSVRSLIEDVIVPRLLQGTVTLVLSDTAGTSAGDTAGDAARSAARLPSRFLSVQHAHDAHEVCWVVRGRCVLALAGRHLALDPGVACLIQPGEVHQLRPSPTLEPFEVLWWQVTSRGISLPVEGFAGERHVVHAGFIAVDLAPASVMAHVVQELRRRQPHCDLLVRALLLQLAAAALRELSEGAADETPIWPGERKCGWHVQRVARYIETHYGTDLTLRRLARLVDVSPYYLTSLFRRYTGRSAMAYVSDVRHRRALALLRNTDLEVAEVARLVGYKDPYYFSRVFKARQGCPPLLYRRLYHAETPSAKS